MRNLRCNSCNNILAKEEGDKIIIRTGYGKQRVFHTFPKKDATLTCWFCKEVKNLEEKGNGKLKRVAQRN